MKSGEYKHDAGCTRGASFGSGSPWGLHPSHVGVMSRTLNRASGTSRDTLLRSDIVKAMQSRGRVPKRAEITF
ncbi:hypothetical protein PMIN01_10404 [Paraphaeosphaeria minitans]|uniref:Uncharacterized protein n=1 Tax=Paraphaeosphaeria minitans TaxID=565426 RepID=A0A9P6G934_9PLEO|nr:hypothetical protein PMIN01_10404 [Paraphaeosphaeria minitans]